MTGVYCATSNIGNIMITRCLSTCISILYSCMYWECILQCTQCLSAKVSDCSNTVILCNMERTTILK